VRVKLLSEKGEMLWHADRKAEAVILFDSAVAAFAELRSAPAPETVALVVRGLLDKVQALVGTRDAAGFDWLHVQLASVLGDDGSRGNPCVRKTSETALAQLLAEVHHGDCWASFAVGGDASGEESLRDRALDLYLRTDVFLRDEDALEEPPLIAALALRSIADGLALLSSPWEEDVRSALPTRASIEWAFRLADVDKWAAEHGSPLVLRESMEEFEAQRDERRTRLLEEFGANTEDDGASLATAVVVAVRTFEVFEALAASSRGREAARDTRIKTYAIWHILRARRWTSWSSGRFDEAEGACLAMMLIAQAAFVIAHGGVSSREDVVPTRSFLRGLLAQSAAMDWLLMQDVELPEWLVDGAEN
jgi:hypothetical protein